jgi:hypothetical protein
MTNLDALSAEGADVCADDLFGLLGKAIHPLKRIPDLQRPDLRTVILPSLYNEAVLGFTRPTGAFYLILADYIV